MKVDLDSKIGLKGRRKVDLDSKIGLIDRQKVDPDSKIGLKGRRKVDPDSKIGLKGRQKVDLAVLWAWQGPKVRKLRETPEKVPRVPKPDRKFIYR